MGTFTMGSFCDPWILSIEIFLKGNNIKMETLDISRFYKDRFRILLIIFFFSDDTDNPNYPKLLHGEIKIQAIDFFIRNPDYLAYELLNIAEANSSEGARIKSIVKSIYRENEPELRKIEMEKFFYGAYEDIDDIIAFLVSRGLIKHESKLRTNGRVSEKHYYITKKASEKIVEAKGSIEVAKWYFKKCKIIKDYLGGATGSELKAKQYQVEEYSSTQYKDKIKDINDMVYYKYYKVFKTNL